MKKLIELYKNPRLNGIFFSMSKNNTLNSLFFNTFGFQAADYHAMDIQYLYNKSGLKTASVLVENFLNGYIVDDLGDFVLMQDGRRVTWDYVMSQVDEDIINTIILHQFYDKWNKLAETLSLQYDVLSPFSMKTVEDITDNLTSQDSNTGKRTDSGTMTDSRKIVSNETDDKTINNTTNYNNTTETENSGTGNGSNTNNENIFGFNSSGNVPANNSNGSNSSEFSNNGRVTDSSSTTDSGSSTDTKNSTVDNNSILTDDKSVNTQNDRNYSRDNTINRNTVRTGNIGNRSNQQLINEQREMLKWQFFDVVYKDLDSVLTRSKYF